MDNFDSNFFGIHVLPFIPALWTEFTIRVVIILFLFCVKYYCAFGHFCINLLILLFNIDHTWLKFIFAWL